MPCVGENVPIVRNAGPLSVFGMAGGVVGTQLRGQLALGSDVRPVVPLEPRRPSSRYGDPAGQVRGQVVMNHDVEGPRYHLAKGRHLQPGLYFVRLTQAVNRRSRRVIVLE